MQTKDLGGEWTLRQAGKREHVRATVPGSVHTDLLASGEIYDPYYRDNEDRLQWIGEVAWIYRRTFYLSSAFLLNEQILLRCEGLDTLSTIIINSREIARTSNMFRTYEFDVKSLLKRGSNTIEIRFDPVVPYIKNREKEYHIPLRKGTHIIGGGNWVRKEQCNFGWDWSPRLLTCGIWRTIQLVAFSTARLSDIHIKQEHRKDGVVSLDITIYISATHNVKSLITNVTVTRGKQRVVEVNTPFKIGKTCVAFTIQNPELWWSNGMGDQPLYDVSVTLLGNDDIILDKAVKRIGLRTLRLQRKKDRWGETFQFIVNGIPFFAKGANWIPADTFAPRVTDGDYADLLKSVAKVHMNMLRVWGGGICEVDVFYDLCDELGICVWQDFMFACATYPTFDMAFMDNIRAEAEDNVRRLRHHPCLVLWCGNNELEQGWVGDDWNDRQMSWCDYSRLFAGLLPDIITKLDPERSYWPCSPHSPYGDRTDYNSDR